MPVPPQAIVDQAALLLAKRQTPSIEVLRQKLGRGSPNHISDALQEWFAWIQSSVLDRRFAYRRHLSNLSNSASPGPAVADRQLVGEDNSNAALQAALQEERTRRETTEAALLKAQSSAKDLAERLVAMARQTSDLRIAHSNEIASRLARIESALTALPGFVPTATDAKTAAPGPTNRKAPKKVATGA